MSTLNVTNLKNEASASNNLTLDSNGRVGVGTSSPNRTFVVESSSGPNLELRRTGFSNYTYIEDDGSNSIYRANGSIVFQTGGVNERARVTNNGITFNGDTAAANALDDYEEGTFTFTLYDLDTGGNASPSTVTGHYTKIGDLVFVSVPNFNNISTSGMTGVNDLWFSLPFTASSSQNGAIGSPLFTSQMTFQSSVSYYAPRVDASKNRGLITGVRSGNTAINMAVNTLTSGATDFGRLTLVYKTV